MAAPSVAQTPRKPQCVLGNRFLAHSKKVIPTLSDKNHLEKGYTIDLITKALCMIDKVIDESKELTNINRYERAGFEVIKHQDGGLKMPMGALKCFYCSELEEDVYRFHTSKDRVADFKIDRVQIHPALCIIDVPATASKIIELDKQVSIAPH